MLACVPPAVKKQKEKEKGVSHTCAYAHLKKSRPFVRMCECGKVMMLGGRIGEFWANPIIVLAFSAFHFP
jgi:hypothetical protein